MIQENELRIGNYLKDREGRLCKVQLIDSNLDDCITGQRFKAPAIVGGITCLPHERIQLTEEILLKCGADRFEFDNGEPNQYRLGSMLIAVRNYSFYDYGSNIKIEYLRDLQNIYFYKNNKCELNVNL